MTAVDGGFICELIFLIIQRKGSVQGMHLQLGTTAVNEGFICELI